MNNRIHSSKYICNHHIREPRPVIGVDSGQSNTPPVTAHVYVKIFISIHARSHHTVHRSLRCNNVCVCVSGGTQRDWWWWRVGMNLPTSQPGSSDSPPDSLARGCEPPSSPSLIIRLWLRHWRLLPPDAAPSLLTEYQTSRTPRQLVGVNS